MKLLTNLSVLLTLVLGVVAKETADDEHQRRFRRAEAFSVEPEENGQPGKVRHREMKEENEGIFNEDEEQLMRFLSSYSR